MEQQMTSRIEYNNPVASGAFGLPYHYELLADKKRMGPLCRSVTLAARGRTVLESGAGSGVLSILAARAGACSVYAVEKDPCVAAFARRNIRLAGVEGIVRLIQNDVRAVKLADLGGARVNMVIAENLSTWNVTEPQVSVMNYVNEHLAEDSAIRIPGHLYHHAELVRSRFRFADAVGLRTYYFQFSGIPRPAVLSEPTLFKHVDMGKINSTSFHGDMCITATHSGVVNSLRLTSPMQVLGSIEFKSSDSLMPPVVVPLPRDLTVRAGDAVRLTFRYDCESEWSQFFCSAELDASPEVNCEAVTCVVSIQPFAGAELSSPALVEE
jgi:predicted RNA methylase